MHYSCDSVWLFLFPFNSLLLGVEVFQVQLGQSNDNDGYVTWHHQSTQSLHQRAAQGLETTTRSSSSYLATQISNLLTLASTQHGNTRDRDQDRDHWKHLVETAMLQLLARDDDNESNEKRWNFWSFMCRLNVLSILQPVVSKYWIELEPMEF